MVYICIRCYKEFESSGRINEHMGAEICNMKVLSLLNTKEQLEISLIPRDNKLDNKVVLHQTMLKVPSNVKDFHEKYKKVKAIYMLKELSKIKEEDELKRKEEKKRLEEERKKKEEDKRRLGEEEDTTALDILEILNSSQIKKKRGKEENNIERIKKVMSRISSDEDDDSEIEIEKFQCEYCLKVFDTKYNLSRHINGRCEFYKMRDEMDIASKEEDLEKEFLKFNHTNPQFLENFKFNRISYEDRRLRNQEESLYNKELRKINEKNRKKKSREMPVDKENFYIITNKNKEEFKARILKNEDGIEYIEKERFKIDMLDEIKNDEDKDLVQYGLSPTSVKEDRLRGFDECLDLSHLDKDTIYDILVSKPKIENLLLKSIENRNNHGVYVFNSSILDNIVYIKKLYNQSIVHNNVLIVMPRELIIKELYDQCKFILNYILMKETVGKEVVDERLKDVKKIEEEINDDYERLKRDIRTHKLILKRIHSELGGLKDTSLEEMFKSVSNLMVFQNMGKHKEGKSMSIDSVKNVLNKKKII